MSQLKLTADSGGGTVAIKGPTSTANNADIELTLDGSGNGTLLTTASNTGKILQVVTAGTNAQISSTTTTLAEITSDLRVSITPSNANNIILVQGFFGAISSATHVMTFQIMKDGTTAVDAPNSSSTNSDGNVQFWSLHDYIANASTCVSETAGNTNTRYYTPFWRINTATAFLNSYRLTSSYKGTSRMVVMEIEA